MSQQFTVLLFGALKDAARTDVLQVQIESEIATVREVLDACVKACPTLKKWTNYLRVAVACEYADEDLVVVP